MATVESETTTQPQSSEGEGKTETAAQEIGKPEHYIKHPLQNRWALWFFKNDKNKTWQANLRLISKFDTVEDFWALYNHIQLCSNLISGCDYSLFKDVKCLQACIYFPPLEPFLFLIGIVSDQSKMPFTDKLFVQQFESKFHFPANVRNKDGIEPMWEDEKNKRGGRWLLTLSKPQRKTDLDRIWLETLLCLIGEAFDEHSDDACGAVVNVRNKGDKIAIWTTDCENRESITYIGRIYKERLGLPPKVVIGYQSHTDTATKSGSTTKNRYVV